MSDDHVRGFDERPSEKVARLLNRAALVDLLAAGLEPVDEGAPGEGLRRRSGRSQFPIHHDGLDLGLPSIDLIRCMDGVIATCWIMSASRC